MKELDDITGTIVDAAVKIHRDLGPGLVERRVVVELKSVEKLAPVHGKQLLTYLRLMDLPVGLLINFGAATLKEGLHRIVNNLPPSATPREPAQPSPNSPSPFASR